MVVVVVVARSWRPDGGGGGGITSVAKLNCGVKGQMAVENDCLLAIIVDIICKEHAAVLRSECHHSVGREQPHSTCVRLRSSTANNSVIHWRPFNPRCFRSLVKCRPNVVCIQIFGGQHSRTISIRNARTICTATHLAFRSSCAKAQGVTQSHTCKRLWARLHLPSGCETLLTK